MPTWGGRCSSSTSSMGSPWLAHGRCEQMIATAMMGSRWASLAGIDNARGHRDQMCEQRGCSSTARVPHALHKEPSKDQETALSEEVSYDVKTFVKVPGMHDLGGNIVSCLVGAAYGSVHVQP